ncbi:monocarboxylate transporter 13-like [Argopecten irradians]|uniref:monocarboxylate transporter 13-like n=1 Tax=Argopecten irradians TaxID=31199 RepID=UPI0037134CDB
MRKLSSGEKTYTHVHSAHSTHAPDGGWGWMVTFSSFVISLFVDGLSFTFGIFFPEFLTYFGESKGKTQLLHSLLWGTFFSLGPVVSILVNKYGSRLVSSAGSVILSVGIFLSSFSSNLEMMIFFYSIVGGIGFGMLYLPSIVIIGVYFERKRALATGIAVCGAGVGGFVFAPLSEFLLEEYSWRGTLWIISAIFLNGVVVSTTFRPLKYQSQTRGNNKINSSSHKITSKNSNLSRRRLCLSCHDMFDFALLKSPTMLLYGASCFLVMFGLFIPTNFLPAHASDVNLSASEGARFILIMGVSNTVSRVVIGYITDKPWANSLIINSILLIIGGGATCCVPLYTTSANLIIYSVLFGAVIATFICLRSILMTELLGVHRLNSSFGLASLSMGLSTYFGSPIAGALSDISGNYNMAFYFAGITLALGGTICLPLRRISEWEKSRSFDLSTSLSLSCNEETIRESKSGSSSIYIISESCRTAV